MLLGDYRTGIVGLLLLAAGCVGAPVIRGSSDSLGDLRKSVRDGAPGPTRTQTPPPSDCDRHCRDDLEDENSLTAVLFGPLLRAGAIGAIHLAGAPFTVPNHWLEGGDLYGSAYFPTWPYDATEGSLIVENPDLNSHRTFGGRLQIFGATDFDDLQRYQVRLLAEQTNRFGVDTETGLLRQTVPDGRDELWLGDFNLTYRFAQSEHVQFRAGIGANWLADSVRGDAGFNFTYQVDVFPREPWTASALFDIGTLGDATLFHGRGTVGVMVRQWEIFTGYDYLSIGDFDSHGVLGGLSLHF